MANEPILIVDDNPTNVRLTRLLLNSAGYDIRSAGDSREALQVLGDFHPRLILMDIQLPGMDGLELTRKLKASPETQDCIIVALTAYAMPGDEQKAKDAGCDGYITKPMDTRLFPSQVRTYLDSVGALKTAVRNQSEPKQTEPKQADLKHLASDHTNDLLADLRTEFIANGADYSREMAESDPSGWNTESMTTTVHHWTGVGGTLGFPKISERARQLEQSVEAGLDSDAVLAGFRAMQGLFAQSLKDLSKPSLPAGLALNLLGRQIALAGFGERETARLCGAFEHVAAVPRNLGSMAAGLGLDGLRSYDLVVVNACTDEGVRSWTSLCSQPLLDQPFLLIASKATLLDRKLDLLDKRSFDFVFAPWDVEELLFRAQRILQTRKEVPAKPQPKNRPVVVLADDDPTIHGILGPMFRKLDFDFFSVHDGSQALEMIKNLKPSVVILDIGMPRVSGMSVLTALQRDPSLRRIPVLMLTARQQETDVSMALGFGAKDYVVKPFDPLDVVTRVTGLVQTPEPAFA